MTPAEFALWSRIQRRASLLSPDMRSAILKAFQALKDRLTDTEIVRAIQSGSIDSIFEKELSDQVLAQAFQPVRDQMRTVVSKSVLYSVRDLPAPKSQVVNFSFDSLAPSVVDAVRQLETRVITDLHESVRETVRQRVQQGLVDGEAPKTIAKDLRSVIGLSPRQETLAQKYEARLVDEGRKASQVERMAATYRRRTVARNADTISRTAVLDSQKLGQKIAIDQAVEQGVITGGVNKTWVGVMDDRERDSHVAMEGQTVPYDQPYSNGQMVPGESEYNCRCISRFTTASTQ